jgi:hypothetical protein
VKSSTGVNGCVRHLWEIVVKFHCFLTLQWLVIAITVQLTNNDVIDTYVTSEKKRPECGSPPHILDENTGRIVNKSKSCLFVVKMEQKSSSSTATTVVTADSIDQSAERWSWENTIHRGDDAIENTRPKARSSSYTTTTTSAGNDAGDKRLYAAFSKDDWCRALDETILLRDKEATAILECFHDPLRQFLLVEGPSGGTNILI